MGMLITLIGMTHDACDLAPTNRPLDQNPRTDIAGCADRSGVPGCLPATAMRRDGGSDLARRAAHDLDRTMRLRD
jgi:hypothetical protein